MKRAFKLLDHYHLGSTMAPDDARDVLSLGDRITLTKDINLGPGALIPAGARGTIDHIDASTGTAEVLMDHCFPGLAEWRNHMWLEPFGTDDILGSVILSRGTFKSYAAMVPRWVPLVAASVVLSTCAAFGHHLVFTGDLSQDATCFTRAMLITLTVTSMATSIS